MQKTLRRLTCLLGLLLSGILMQAQDTMNRHWVSAGLSYSMPQLDGQPMPSGVSANRFAPLLRYAYGKTDGWFLRLQARGTWGSWPLDKPANFNVTKKYRGMQYLAGVGRHWPLKKQWVAVKVLDGSLDRFVSEDSYGGGVTGEYRFYDGGGNMVSAGLSAGLEYRLNTRWSVGMDTRLSVGALSKNLDVTDPLSSSNQVVESRTFKVIMQWTPVQALYVSYRF